MAWYEPTDGGVYNVWVEGDTLYLGNYHGGARVLDISGELKGDLLRQGREISWIFTADSMGARPRYTFAWGVVVKNGVMFVPDINTGSGSCGWSRSRSSSPPDPDLAGRRRAGRILGEPHSGMRVRYSPLVVGVLALTPLLACGDSTSPQAKTIGISLRGGYNNVQIEKNTIHHIQVAEGMLQGIALTGGEGNGKTTVQKNRLYNFTNTQPTINASGYLYGIYLRNVFNNVGLVNNQVSIYNDNLARPVPMYGIYQYSNGSFNRPASLLRMQYNSVYLGGTSNLTATSSCVYLTSNINSNQRMLYNNLLVNERTGGSGGNYALSLASSVSNPPAIIANVAIMKSGDWLFTSQIAIDIVELSFHSPTDEASPCSPPPRSSCTACPSRAIAIAWS